MSPGKVSEHAFGESELCKSNSWQKAGSNYAFKPIAEQVLRPNQTAVPQRLNAALDLMPASKMTRIEYLEALAEDNSLFDDVGLIAAMCWCLDPTEACAMLYVHGTWPSRLREPLLRKIESDAKASFLEAHKELVERFVEDLDRWDARGRQSLGACISRLIPVCSNEVKANIYPRLARSGYIGVRRRAYKALMSDEPDFLGAAMTAWERYRDPECAWIMTKRYPVSFVCEKRHEFLKVMKEPWRVSQLYLGIGVEYPKVVQELRDIDGISYCYVLCKLGYHLSDRRALSIAVQNSADERFGLLVWSLGRLGKWKVLAEVRKRLPEFREAQLLALRNRHKI